MNKTLNIVILISGVGLLIWLISKIQPKQGQTVIVPTASTTGSAGIPSSFFNAFNRVPTSPVKYDNRGDQIKAIGGLVTQLPGVIKGLGDAFSTWRSPVQTVKTPAITPSTPVGSSYEEYYGVGGWA